MPSQAFAGHLRILLKDAELLADSSVWFKHGVPDRFARVAALSRAVVVMSVSAWEAYIEEIVRESLDKIRPTSPPLGLWPALNATIRGRLGRFNNPNTENVRMILSDALGLQGIQSSWSWRNCTSTQAVQRLAVAMELRHKIAHGVSPRPIVSRFHASQLPDFFRRLGRCTDRAIRHHLMNVLGITSPWPP